ncbi:MAG: Efflux transporter periplasmic adaptor subunit [Parachlamydiales bacterium]|nr:Efflux transporter periplasmic adaptor subunit [Parachlamydiales bacterium]
MGCLMRILRIPSFVVILSLIAVWSCNKTSKSTAPPVAVVAMRIEPKTLPADVEYIGVAESSHIVEIRARVEGVLQSIHYQEGGRVNQGDLMFVIDPRPLNAAVEKAKSAVENQKAILWNANQVKGRMLPLYQQNAVSQHDLDNAISNQLSAEASLQSAQADLYQAELNLSFASIEAPVSGFASQATYREGALISPGERGLLTTLYVVDPIWVNFSVADRDRLEWRNEIEKKWLKWPEKMNFKVEAILSDGTIFPTEGVIDFTNPAIEQSTGTMLFRAVFSNPNRLLFPGQFVRVILKGATHPNAIFVPQTAVIQSNQGPSVFVIEQGKAQRKLVVLGNWFQDYWIVHEGLKEGDLVIAQGVNKVQNGSPVIIQEVMSGVIK